MSIMKVRYSFTINYTIWFLFRMKAVIKYVIETDSAVIFTNVSTYRLLESTSSQIKACPT